MTASRSHLPPSAVNWYFSGVADGDFAVPSSSTLSSLSSRLSSASDANRSSIGSLGDEPSGWAWARQVHGADVLVVDRAELAGDGDALVTSTPGLALTIRTADCCPVLLWNESGTIAAVHAGWRGLVAGVIENAIEAMQATSGSAAVGALIGPAIGPCCYEFGEDDMALAVDRFGDEVRSETTAGALSLDVVSGVRTVLAGAEIPAPSDRPPCTRCAPGYFSHRRGDAGRQVSVIVMNEDW